MHWETLLENAQFRLRRSGRFLVTELLSAHRVLSTSACNGGQSDDIQYLVNHQSCEGTAHHSRHKAMTEAGLARYHDDVCAEAGDKAADTTAHTNKRPMTIRIATL